MQQKEISPGCGFFLPKSTISTIMDDCKEYKDGMLVNIKWQNIIKEALLHVYGDSLRNYSATGKRSQNNAIDRKFFNGLYGTY